MNKTSPKSLSKAAIKARRCISVSAGRGYAVCSGYTLVKTIIAAALALILVGVASIAAMQSIAMIKRARARRRGARPAGAGRDAPLNAVG